MNLEKYHKIAIAMAGMLQTAALVRDLAKTGKADSKAFATSIHSLYKLKSDNILDIYGGDLEGLRYGLETLIEIFSKKTTRDPDISRYFVSLIFLERKLYVRKPLQAAIYQRILEAQKKAEYFDPLHENLITHLADTYLATISQFRYRIQILGARSYLSPPANLNKIRALLLAGIRAAVLWRQMGGNRLQIIFSEKKLVQATKEVLEQMSQG